MKVFLALVSLVLVCALSIAACDSKKFGAVTPLVGSPAPIDTAVGDLQNVVVSFPEAGTQFLVRDAGSYFICANGFNEGTLPAWLHCFNQPTLDSGGMDGQSPGMLPIRIPGGAGFSFCEPQPFQNGIACYSSASQGTYNPASVQPIAVDFTIR